MTSIHRLSPHGPRAVVVLLAALLTLAMLPLAAQAYETPPEDYSGYQPQTRCRKHTRPGTAEFAAWIERRYAGGPARASVRDCNSGGTSEHKDGRAIDWRMNAAKKAQRKEVKRFLRRLFRADAEGNEHALARRTGIMYIIWNDRMWASYDRFEVKDYSVSVACKRTRTCTKTARHRDHVHISLSKPGGRGDTSWYTRRL